MHQRIAIVGAGQSGLQMALGLQAHGYRVTLLSNRTPAQIRAGKVMSSQCMFDRALQTERELGLNWWDDACPPVQGIGLAVPHPELPGAKVIDWAAPLDRPAQAVDQRLKMPAWMEAFVARGGDLRILDVGVDELEDLTREHDLVLLAAGKGEIVSRFERDASRSPFDRPQRALALTYVTGMLPREPFSRVCFNLIPGVGEYFVFPALTLSGPCEIMVFEGIPGGPMDRWAEASTPEQHLAESLRILRTYAPWEAERCAQVALTDDNGILSGRFAPTVRKPVLTLPSGRLVFGMADAVVVNDPITGQGSNNAAKCCKVYLDAIVGHGERAYDRDWMEQTFARYWQYAGDVVAWTNSLLTSPPPHILALLGAAGQAPALAARIANGFDNPPDYFPWWMDPQACHQLIDHHLPRAA
ncbi:putative OXYGENASE; putative exported protein [Cupriavidus phytorum]|uniref:Flavin-dependent dehydrogenase n=2 Tax=Cupriavidus TaxID=106589 RepID=A0A2W7NVQ7_9BURK|nr:MULTISPECIES: styrene monooxygenase/indole monooxygenase family protein [Cupriavidus]PZX23006.1 flavin-dependent dehydrogenase [Cupriavidus alkaliphilus]SOY61013.1 putative OXYGENASE; putative exported protein [Cupriavidus taiwanensis]